MKKIFVVVVFALMLVQNLNAAEQKYGFNMPTDIKVYDGKIFVVDGLNNRISVLSASFRKLYDITVPSPYGIYAEGEKIYVTNQKGKVYILNKFGDILKTINVDGRPVDVVKVGENLWITDGKDNCIKITDMSGNVIKKIGGKGSSPGSFIGPFMIAKSKRFVFVTDTINSRVQVFDFEGNLKAAFGKFGIEEGNLFRPKGVCVCGENVVVSDPITGAVQMFTPFGGFERVLLRNLEYPIGVDCRDGKVYIVEMLKNDVRIFSAQGDSR